MSEEAILFGASKNLVGVLTRAADDHKGKKPAVVILNAGVLHHVGPNRLHVKLARKLAKAGFNVIRFDYSGIGDSNVNRKAISYQESTIAECQAAMRLLQQRVEADRFVLMGICSGADNSFRVACKDEKVIGAVLIDGYAFPTAKYYLKSYSRRLLDFRSWLNFLSGKSDFWGLLRDGLRVKTAGPKRQQVDDWQYINAETILDGMRKLLARDVNLCFIYSGGSPAYFNYQKRLRRPFRNLQGKEKMRIEYLAEADHTFTLSHNQEKLINVVLDWSQKFNGRAN